MTQSDAIAPLNPSDKRTTAPVRRICVRCKGRSSIVLQTATYCHDCFQTNFESKVRQNLEQGRLCTYLHRNEEASSSKYPCEGRIAIGFSGGAASRALLHIASERLSTARRGNRGGKAQEVHAIDVVYVDTSAVVEGAHDETEAVQRMVQEEGGGEADGIHFWPLKLHDVFDDDHFAECTSESASIRYLSIEPKQTTDREAALRLLFESIQPKDTPKGALSNARSRAEDLVALLTTHLLRKQAIRKRATCLMTGETSTRAAIRLVDSIGKGRGHKVSVEEGSIRWNGLFLLRPMKAVSSKEVSLYTRGKRLSFLPPSDIIAMQLLSGKTSGSGQEGGNGNKASMGRLTESLIHLLEKNVASTVSTINKVGDKLVFSDDLASHGYDQGDDTGKVDVNASSSTAFHQVGPSVPLRHRKRQDSTSTQLSSMSLASTGPALGAPGDRSLQGLGLGRLGGTLYYAAKNMLVYNGTLACPLCQMPSQRGLHDWKRGLTIKSEQVDSESAPGKRRDINLTELLCYACSMVLDTPESAKERPASMALPTFVLDGARRRIMEAEGKVTLSHEDISAVDALTSAPSNNVNGNGTAHHDSKTQHEIPAALQKLNQEQMKHHINGFLLNNDDETPQTTQRQKQRRQTDW